MIPVCGRRMCSLWLPVSSIEAVIVGHSSTTRTSLSVPKLDCPLLETYVEWLIAPFFTALAGRRKTVARGYLMDRSSRAQLPKAKTGIAGLDEITQGGLPAGRPTLICGTAGCGKTLFA